MFITIYFHYPKYHFFSSLVREEIKYMLQKEAIKCGSFYHLHKENIWFSIPIDQPDNINFFKKLLNIVNELTSLYKNRKKIVGNYDI